MGGIRPLTLLCLALPLAACSPNVRPIYESEAGAQILKRLDALEAVALIAVANSRKLDRDRVEAKFSAGLKAAGESVPAAFVVKWADERHRALSEVKAYHDKQAHQIKTNAAQARGLKLAQDAAILKTIDLARVRSEDLAKMLITAARIAAKVGGAP